MTFKLPERYLRNQMNIVSEKKLIVPIEYNILTFDQMLNIANGIGPDRFSATIHNIADDVLERFVPASIPHDVGYEYAKGTKDHWHLVNAQFLSNCFQLLPPIGLKHEALATVAYGLFLAVESNAGWDSYMAAFERGPVVKITTEKENI